MYFVPKVLLYAILIQQICLGVSRIRQNVELPVCCSHATRDLRPPCNTADIGLFLDFFHNSSQLVSPVFVSSALYGWFLRTTVLLLLLSENHIPKDNLRARLRTMVKALLKRCTYPPDMKISILPPYGINARFPDSSREGLLDIHQLPKRAFSAKTAGEMFRERSTSSSLKLTKDPLLAAATDPPGLGARAGWRRACDGHLHLRFPLASRP